MSGSTIASTITNEVTLGYSGFFSPLSITSAGAVDVNPGVAILIEDIAGGSLINSGTVSGGTDGVYLEQSSAVITNKGVIFSNNTAIKVSNFSAGGALINNSGTLAGSVGITGQEAEILNTGLISGNNYGIHLQISTVSNAVGGTIEGQGGIYLGQGTLINDGGIFGASVGISLSGGTALNVGEIAGSVGAGAEVNDVIGTGSTIAGSLTNDGTITGGNYGVSVGTGNFTNNAYVDGQIGLSVQPGGHAANAGTLYGVAAGASLIGRLNSSAGASLANTGKITSAGTGTALGVNAQLQNSGYIYGANAGVSVYDGYLTNSGSILNALVGVTLSGTAAVAVNAAAGTIAAFSDGVDVSGGLLSNYGTIYGVTNGVFITGGSLANFRNISGGTYGVADSGANVTNYGAISGAQYGVTVARGTLTNAGTIAGGIDAVEGSFITLAVDPGAVFVGDVQNVNGKSLLELAGNGIGTLGGIGSQITGFKNISFATGPQWSIEGNEAGLGQGDTITGFARSDTITLDGFTATSENYVKNLGLELFSAAGTVTLGILGNFSTGSFTVTDSGANTQIVDVTCFAEGTRIATATGEAAVETLRIGMPVRTLQGGVQQVKWIGRRRYGGGSLRDNKAALPIRIRAGAIAEGVPARDLRVSPGHAISIDGALIHAGRLVNGVSVLQEAVEEVTYYHVELAEHEILLAENCPAESFMDEHFRRQFHNAEEYALLYPGHLAPDIACQPRLMAGFGLDAIQRRLRARAGLAENQAIGDLRGFLDRVGPSLCFGWAQDMAAPQRPVSLDIFRDGRRIARVLANLYRADVAAAGFGDGYQGFEYRLEPGVSGKIEVCRSSDKRPLRLAAESAVAA